MTWGPSVEPFPPRELHQPSTASHDEAQPQEILPVFICKENLSAYFIFLKLVILRSAALKRNERRSCDKGFDRSQPCGSAFYRSTRHPKPMEIEI